MHETQKRGRETFKMRNRIERWLRILKAKLKRFYNTSTANTTTKPIERFARSLHNHLQPDAYQ